MAGLAASAASSHRLVSDSAVQSCIRQRCSEASTSQGCPVAALSASPVCSGQLPMTAASGHGGQGLRSSQYQFDEDEPMWLAVVRDLAAGLRSLVAFLVEQPRQLKHIEWPGFQNTLRTATLTLIVALASVDATLSYILSWLLRKSA